MKNQKQTKSAIRRSKCKTISQRKAVKVFFTLIILTSNFIFLKAQIPIKSSVFGLNYSLSSQVGNNTMTGGLLETYWPQTVASDPTYFRFGGIEVDKSCDELPTSITDYFNKAKAMRDKHIEPILQVPLNLSVHSTFAGAATAAGQIVKNVNDMLVQQGSLPVLWWCITNEPEGGLHNFYTSSAATDIHDYIVAYSNQMRAQGYPIKLMGPELYNFDNYNHGTGNINTLIDKLTDSSSPTTYILPYIDAFTFHFYPFNDEGTTAPTGVPSPTRSNVINFLQNSVTVTGGGSSVPLSINLQYLKSRIASCPFPDNQVKIGITEANICFKNDVYPTDSYNITDDSNSGNGANSFIAGQFNAEMTAVCMQNGVDFLNIWSVVEGCNSSSTLTCGTGNIDNNTNIGYIDDITGSKKSTYHHFKMMADYFKGTFYMGTVQSGKGDFKAFASKSCDGIYIMILNQNTTTTINAAKINLNGTMPSTSSTQVGIQLGSGNHKVAPTTNILISHINPEETMLIKCDPCGKPLSYKTYNKTMSVPDPFVNFPGYQRSCACLNANFDNTATSPLRCSNIDTSSITHPHIVAPGNLVISDSMWVPNTIRVPNGATLTINNAEVVFSAGAKIYTDPPTYSSPGGQVIIMNSYLHGCDGANWQGITVSNHNDSGYVPITIQQSTIHDALVAVHADSVTGGIITESEFSNGTTAIQLNNCKNFTIDNNSIGNYTTGIQTTNSMAGPSSISGNFITGVSTAISMLNDNHSGLTIGCNDFYNYTNYAVRSINCTLRNQGSALQGAGNIFTSSSLLLNNKFSHSGNNITYYTDPSYPFTLVSGIGMNATTVLAQSDGCGGSSRMANEAGQSVTQINNTEDKAAILASVPNPATEQASIFFSLGKDNTAGEIVLTNVFGEIISRYKVSAATNKIDIDCAKMANGIYFSSLLINGKIKDTKKMMIAR